MNRTKRVSARPKNSTALEKVVFNPRRILTTGSFKGHGFRADLPGDEAVPARHTAN